MVVVAVDIGGSKIKATIVSSNLTVDYSLEVPTLASKGKDVVLKTLVDAINVVLSKTKRKVSAIGISLPGVVKNNNVLFGGDVLGFLTNAPLQSLLKKKFKVPVMLANDADCFTLAESTFGAAKDYKKVLGIIWGSGVGSGIVVKTLNSSIILSGSELGHINIYDSFKKKSLSVESICGGLSVEKEYKKLTGEKLSMPEIYSSKNRHAKLLINRMIKSMAKAIAMGVQTIAPDIVVLGGGVSNLPVLTKLKSEVKKELIDVYAKSFNIKRFEIADDSGLYGAAIFALNKKS